MIKRRKRHTTFRLNTTSTADISFMLLIFFLVTTSMDSDKGLGRQLPPLEPDRQEEVTDVDRKLIITLHLMAGGRLTANEKPAECDATLRKELRHFIIEKGRRHIIELQVDRDADYDSYFRLQNQIVRAYTELRNGAAKKKYGVAYGDCNEEQRQAIVEAYPQRIQETTNVGTPEKTTRQQ